eukprot:TRINITY_DN10463_c0_g1_i1.p1 TRINITY_DN10463_c0_g1~~TRINITY_DN10463_c0_g1_i1.p1  ORF type:complete len:721 (-),score=169.31 TRINITY_DN10463_c0_g1_i1:39-2012(-)
MTANFDIPKVCARIMRTIRGVGDPVASIYARAYAVTQISRLRTSKHNVAFDGSTMQLAVDDTLAVLDRVLSNRFSTLIDHLCVKIENKHEFIEVVSPAVSWILYNYVNKASDVQLETFLEQYKSLSNHALLLFHILEVFPSAFVSLHSMQFCDLAVEAKSDHFEIFKLYKVFGQCLNDSLPPFQERLSIFNKIWRCVTVISDCVQYCEVSVVFVQYIVSCFSSRELNIFLGDVLRHVKPMQAYTTVQTQLSNMLQTIVAQNKIPLAEVLTIDNFLPILDLIVDKPLKKVACKSVLHQFKMKPFRVSDAHIMHALLDVGKSLHDSVDILNLHNELNEINELIIALHTQVDFGNDLEQQLSVYVDFRKSFPNLDLVNKILVHSVNKLAMRAHNLLHGKHNSRTSAFVKACVAYNHITIPSLDDPFDRIQLFLTCSQVALINGLVGQGEGLLKAAIGSLTSFSEASDEQRLATWIQHFLSFALVFPGHPETGPFMLINGLINAINECSLWENPTEWKSRIFVDLVVLCASFAQSKFPYGIAGVDSNDLLFGGIASYMDELNQLLSLAIETTLEHLQFYGEKGKDDQRCQILQASVALDLANAFISFIEMTQSSALMVLRLIRLAAKNSAVDQGYLKRTIEHVSSKKGQWYRTIKENLEQR